MGSSQDRGYRPVTTLGFTFSVSEEDFGGLGREMFGQDEQPMLRKAQSPFLDACCQKCELPTDLLQHGNEEVESV